MKVKTNHFNVVRYTRAGFFSRLAKQLGLRRRMKEVLEIDRAEIAA